MQDFWDQRYKINDYLFGKEPNEFFRTFIDSLPAGKLLLPGAGEGRNAIYAAEIGWEVDALDISPIAREKALRFAQEEGIDLRYRLQDVRSIHLQKDYYDVAALIFLQLPPQDRKLFHQKVAESLKPNGGNLYLLAFSREEENLHSSGLPDASLLYSPQELMSDFKDLNIDLLQEEETTLAEGEGHKGKAKVIKMTAIRRQQQDESDRFTL